MNLTGAAPKGLGGFGFDSAGFRHGPLQVMPLYAIKVLRKPRGFSQDASAWGVHRLHSPGRLPPTRRASTARWGQAWSSQSLRSCSGWPVPAYFPSGPGDGAVSWNVPLRM